MPTLRLTGAARWRKLLLPAREAFIDRVRKQPQLFGVGYFQQRWQAGRIFSRTLTRVFRFCVKQPLLALWNQHGRFQLLCPPTLFFLLLSHHASSSIKRCGSSSTACAVRRYRAFPRSCVCCGERKRCVSEESNPQMSAAGVIRPSRFALRDS